MCSFYKESWIFNFNSDWFYYVQTFLLSNCGTQVFPKINSLNLTTRHKNDLIFSPCFPSTYSSQSASTVSSSSAVSDSSSSATSSSQRFKQREGVSFGDFSLNSDLLPPDVVSHMKEHMDIPRDVTSMSEEELMFHYFRMHDVDLNGKLDGCELIKSLIHWASKDRSLFS